MSSRFFCLILAVGIARRATSDKSVGILQIKEHRHKGGANIDRQVKNRKYVHHLLSK